MEYKINNNLVSKLNTNYPDSLILVYGAGYVGHIIIQYLLSFPKLSDRLYVAVTSLQGNPPDILGVPVVEIDKAVEDKNSAVVLLAAMEKLHEELSNNAKIYGYQNIIPITNEWFLEIRRIINDYSADILQSIKDIIEKNSRIRNEIRKISDRMNQMEEEIIRVTPQPYLNYLVLNILDHCNLDCKGCDHFSSIAPERFIDLDVVEKDLSRMNDLFHGAVSRIGVMGGEPLLHPQLLKILQLTRYYFPDTIIQLVTNGILLLKQEDRFWQICREQNIQIINTKYPINLNFEAMKEKAALEGVMFEHYGKTGETIKTLYKMTLDLNGQQDARKSFLHCSMANNCNLLMEGKIYPCTIAPNIHIFNDKFGKNLKLEAEDYIDIYKAGSKQEVLEFLSKPIPFCRYCNVNLRNYGYPWERSRQEISEWTEE
jgi:organic radical activating enzyme